MKHLITCAAALVALGAIHSDSTAHHAFAAEFDPDKPVVLRGKITRIEWINPHSWIHIEVPGEKGAPQKWMVEGGTPNTLIRNGLTRNTLKVGTEIIVRGYQSKDEFCEPACKANGRDITFTDGRKIFMGSSGTGAPKDGSDPTEGR
jgi:Family of unknown function (DUF6152)